MALAILGNRIIGPHFGVGPFVGNSLLAVVLSALALGYWLGGQIADRRPSLLLFSGVLFAAAAVVALIPLWRVPVVELGWKFGLRGGSLFAATCLFFPPLLLLGMAPPIAVRLEAGEVSQAGRAAGRIHAVSMVGAAAGAVLVGFWLLPSFRVPTVLACVAGVLAIAAFLGIGPGFRRRAVVATLAITLGGIIFARPKPQPPELLALRTSDISDVRAISYEGSRYLMADQSTRISVNEQGRTKEKHLYFLTARLLLARPQTQSAALIGLGGGGIVPLLRENGVNVECVDPSPEMIELARDHLGLSLPPSQTHAMDGRVFLKNHPGAFNSVILDVFTGDRPSHTLSSVEGLQTAKAALTPGGLLAVNTWGIDEERAVPNQSGAAIRMTLQQVFKHVLAVPAAGNLLFLASDEPILPVRSSIMLTAFDVTRHFTWLRIPPITWPDSPVLTDDWNPLATLDTASLEAIRLSRRASMPAPVREALAWE